jgi:hypothetical protein
MDRIKMILLCFSLFTFLISIVLTGKNISFYFKNSEMYSNPKKYTKEYVLIDSTYTKTVGRKNSRELTYGLSKKFDNYKTTFDLNNPDGSAVFDNDIPVEFVRDSLNGSNIYYYVWVNKEKKKGFICNENEKSIKENWIFLDRVLRVQLNVGLLVFSLIIFYWLEVNKVFQKKKNM